MFEAVKTHKSNPMKKVLHLNLLLKFKLKAAHNPTASMRNPTGFSVYEHGPVNYSFQKIKIKEREGSQIRGELQKLELKMKR